MRRAVLDSTVLISAFLRPGGLSDELLMLASQGSYSLVLAPEIIAETWRKLLTSARIRARYTYTDERVHTFCRGLLRISEVVRHLPPISGIVRDPNDDMIIACAVAGAANFVVTRDQDLLSLRVYGEIAVIIPEDFVHLVRAQGATGAPA